MVKYIIAASGILLTAALLYLQLWFNFDIHQNLSNEAEAVIFVFFGLFITERISSFRAQRASEERLKSLIENVRSGLHVSIAPEASVSFIGHTVDAFSHIRERITSATHVKNIFVSTLEEEESDVLTDYAEQRENIPEIVLDVLRRDYVWIDVLGPRKVCREREEAIAKLCSSTNVSMDKYEARVLKSDTPILNFVIIEYEKDAEVLFGFGLHEHDKNGFVFASQEPFIVQMFNDYFSTLASNKYSSRIR